MTISSIRFTPSRINALQQTRPVRFAAESDAASMPSTEEAGENKPNLFVRAWRWVKENVIDALVNWVKSFFTSQPEEEVAPAPPEAAKSDTRPQGHRRTGDLRNVAVGVKTAELDNGYASEIKVDKDPSGVIIRTETVKNKEQQPVFEEVITSFVKDGLVHSTVKSRGQHPSDPFVLGKSVIPLTEELFKEYTEIFGTLKDSREYDCRIEGDSKVESYTTTASDGSHQTEKTTSNLEGKVLQREVTDWKNMGNYTCTQTDLETGIVRVEEHKSTPSKSTKGLDYEHTITTTHPDKTQEVEKTTHLYDEGHAVREHYRIRPDGEREVIQEF
jgi:hypothetical protein